MIAVVISILVTTLSLVMAFFLAVGNVHSLVEKDFIHKANDNAVMHSLRYGQLHFRDKSLNSTVPLYLQAGAVRRSGTQNYTDVNYTIAMQDGKNITVDVRIK